MEPLVNSYDLVTAENGTAPVVELAVFDAARASGEHSELDAAVMDQLHQFVHTISTMYDEHAFHNLYVRLVTY
jgi:hypothetical protein